MSKKVMPVVALDIGNVCLQLEFERCSKTAGVNEFWHFFQSNPEIYANEVAIEQGLMSIPSFFDKTSKVLGLPQTQFKNAWFSIIGEEMPGMDIFIKTLIQRGLQPVFFSNISWPHWHVCSEKMSFVPLMTGAVLSCDALSVKPQSGIYEAMEKRYCQNGIPCLYLDDRPENIAAGKERGWNSHVFTSIDDAWKALKTTTF